ncbi:unnamed protein product [Taenia asiatica]|uniref:BPTI/Kunitz inhibitor domain-containing protein n=1 Tax=Taenia asiatica TaxID=60517 RepID=A0A0R3WAZ9_TAEAS|nr:unnamed protein product [Taenia asiatica]
MTIISLLTFLVLCFANFNQGSLRTQDSQYKYGQWSVKLKAFVWFSGKEDICNLPLDIGLCRAYMEVWGYNSTAGHCVKFVYGGCGGNENNFFTKKECRQTCEKKLRKRRSSFRHGDVYLSLQLAQSDRTYYDLLPWPNKQAHKVTAREVVWFSGNRDICSQPIDKGNGRARISAWGYDVARGHCVHFFYSGAGGNENRFQTLKKCRRACGNVFLN